MSIPADKPSGGLFASFGPKPRRSKTCRSRSALHRRLRLEPLEDRRLLAVLTVNSTLDNTTSGDGLVTLREAIIAANNNTTTDLGQVGSGADTLDLTSLSGTIQLAFGEFWINQALTINGPGQTQLTIDARQMSRVFNIIATTGNFEISGLTLQNGRTLGDNQTAGDYTHSGGAIRAMNNGTLTVRGSTITGGGTHGAYAVGGGIFSRHRVALVDSTVNDNSTAGVQAGGGGVASGEVTLTNSSVKNNSTSGDYSRGGGVVGSNVVLTGSTVQQNTTAGRGADGGGIGGVNSTVTLTESMVSGNITTGLASRGGGIYGNHVALTESLVSGNHTMSQDAVGGGIAATDVTLTNSAVSGNTTFGVNAFGGGISVRSEVTLTDSAVRDNVTNGVGAAGGGISVGVPHDDILVTLFGSTVSGNRTAGNASPGGGIFAYQTNVFSSTVSNNSTGGDSSAGGGISSDYIDFVNSTLSGNGTSGEFSHAGGAFGTHLKFNNATIAHNRALGNSAAGGGIVQIQSGGQLSIRNSIVAMNSSTVANPDLLWETTTGPNIAFSLIGNNGGTLLPPAPIGSPDANGNLVGADDAAIDPLLNPLGFNGGAIFADGSQILTHSLHPSSPALNAGDPNFNPNVFAPPVANDQRGAPYSRVHSGRIDVGAIEDQASTAPLAGDYNQDGSVDAADNVVWRNTLGTSVTPYTGADGSGNGIVDAADRLVWMANFGRTSPPPAATGGMFVETDAAHSTVVAETQFVAIEGRTISQPTIARHTISVGVHSTSTANSNSEESESRSVRRFDVWDDVRVHTKSPAKRETVGRLQTLTSKQSTDAALLAWLSGSPAFHLQREDSDGGPLSKRGDEFVDRAFAMLNTELDLPPGSQR